MIVTPKIEHVQMIVTEMKQMTLHLYLIYLIAKFVIPFTYMYAYAAYNNFFSKNIMFVAYIHFWHVEQIAKA